MWWRAAYVSSLGTRAGPAPDARRPPPPGPGRRIFLTTLAAVSFANDEIMTTGGTYRLSKIINVINYYFVAYKYVI